jgi:hypothetical protein
VEKLKLEDVKKELATENALTSKEQTDVKGGWYYGYNPYGNSGSNPYVQSSRINGGGTSGNMRRPNG